MHGRQRRLETQLGWVTLMAMVLVGAAGCGGGTVEATDGCVPGQVQRCSCSGAATGRQTCQSDGTFGACRCPDTAAGESEPDTGDETRVDAGGPEDTGPTPDTGTPSDTWTSSPETDTGEDTGPSRDSSSADRTVTLPIEVIGPDGTTEQIAVGVDQPESVERLYLRAYSIGYPYHYIEKRGYETPKASVRLNGNSWVEVTNANVTCEKPEAEARCVNGPFHTVEFTIPIDKLGAVEQGTNTLEFRFNYADPPDALGDPSTGYRILGVEMRGGGGSDRIVGTRFEWDEPASWQAPEGYRNESAVDAGAKLWHKRDHMVDSWDGEPITAACADCHVDSGYDLEYFGFSNHSIIQRSKFHGLSEKQGKQIAAYIRSIELKTEQGTGYAPPGRPWDPPYQPGPTAEASRDDGAERTAGKGFDELAPAKWAAGAGLEWELNHDDEVKEFLFPNGVRYEGDVKIDASLNARQLPVALQMPDWNAWLPVHHPIDIWGDRFTSSDVWKHYTNAVPQALQSGKPGEVRRVAKHLGAVWNKTPKVDVFRPSSAPEPYDLGIASAARAQWALVKSFETLHVHHFENDAQSVYGSHAAPLQWLSNARPIFNQAPHITGAGDPRGDKSEIFDLYHDAAWYHLQMVVNSGQGFTTGQSPVDWKYHFAHISAVSGVGGLHAWRYIASFLRLIQNAEMLGPDEGFRSEYRPEGWYLRHTSISAVDRRHGWGEVLQGLSDEEYRKALDVVVRAWIEGIGEEPLSEWKRNVGQWGIEPESWEPSYLNRLVGSTKLQYADHIYTAAQDFEGYGLDPKILGRLTDWGEKLWPKASNPSWDEIAGN